MEEAPQPVAKSSTPIWVCGRPRSRSTLTLLSSPSYEVQLESKVRRKGLGKFLIQILQLMANR